MPQLLFHTMVFLFLTSCKAGSIFVDRLCTDGACQTVINAGEKASDKKDGTGSFSIYGGSFESFGDPVLVSWEASASAASYEVVTTNDKQCSKVKTTQTVKKRTAAIISNHPVGSYFLCVFALTAGKKTAAENNGLPLQIGHAPGSLLWEFGNPYTHTNDADFSVIQITRADANHVYVEFEGHNYYRPGYGRYIYKFDLAGVRDEDFEIELSDCNLANDLKAGPSGNLYIGCITNNYQASSLLKYSPNGDLLWKRDAHATEVYTVRNQIALDAAENIYIATPIFDSAPQYHHNHLTKYSLAGVEDTAQWNKTINMLSNFFDREEAVDLAVDAVGDVILLGQIKDLVNGSSGLDIFIKKFSGSGIEDTGSWNKQIHHGADDTPYALAVDGTNVYVTATMRDMVSAASEADGVILKYDATGVEDTVNWRKVFHTGDLDYIAGIAVDPTHHVYVHAYDDGADVQKIKKFDTSGNEILAGWDKATGGLGWGNSLSIIGSNLFIFSSGENLFSATSGSDGLIEVFDFTGVEDTSNWHKIYDVNQAAEVIPQALQLASDGSLMILGETSDLQGEATGASRFVSFVDQNGNEDVGKRFSFTESGLIRSTAIDGDGDLFIAVEDIGAMAVRIRKFATDGSEDLSWNVSTPISVTYDTIKKIIPDEVGSIYVCASLSNVDSPTSSKDLVVKKYLADASLSWQYLLPSNGNKAEECRDISLFNGFVYVLGRVENDVKSLVKRLDAGTGALDNTWEVASFNDGANYNFMGVSPAGYITLFGGKQNGVPGSNSYDLAVKGFQANGQADPQLLQFFDNNGKQDIITGIKNTPNGDYIIFGNTNTLPFNTYDIFMKRMASNGSFLPQWDTILDKAGYYDSAIASAVTDSGDVFILSTITVIKSGYNARREFILQKFAAE